MCSVLRQEQLRLLSGRTQLLLMTRGHPEAKMRRVVTALLSSLAIGLPFPAAIAAAARVTVHATPVSRKLVGQTAQAGQWGTVSINVTAQTTGTGTRSTRSLQRSRRFLHLSHLAVAVHHVAGASGSAAGVPHRPEREEHPDGLRRHLYERGVPPVAPVGAAQGQVSSSRRLPCGNDEGERAAAGEHFSERRPRSPAVRWAVAGADQGHLSFSHR